MRSIIKLLLFATGIFAAFLIPYKFLAIALPALLILSRKIRWKIIVPITLYIFAANYLLGGLDAAIAYSTRVLFLLLLSSALTFSFREIVELPLPKSIYIPVILAYRYTKILERDANLFREAYKARFGELRLKDYIRIYSALVKHTLQKVDEVAVAVYLKEEGIDFLRKKRRMRRCSRS